jgi:hypothetical protein
MMAAPAVAGVIADLSADWSYASNPNNTNPIGTWEYRGNIFDLPLQSSWLGGGPAYAPADTLDSDNFTPAELQADASYAAGTGGNILPGDVLTWTVSHTSGDVDSYANYLFTSNVAGTFDISGYLWDADLSHPDRPQYWYLILYGNTGNTVPITSGYLDGSVSRGEAETFNVIAPLSVGSTVELEMIDEAGNESGSWLVGNELTISTLGGAATPEPATFALFGVGLAALGLVRRRKTV